MKLLTFISFACLVFAACNLSSSQQDTSGFVAGIYIRTGQTEYGTIYDTLLIELQNEAANEYRITRHWRYDRVIDGKPLEPKYEERVTVAVLNKEQGRLAEYGTGDFYSIDIKNNLLYNGPVKYFKQ